MRAGLGEVMTFVWGEQSVVRTTGLRWRIFAPILVTGVAVATPGVARAEPITVIAPPARVATIPDPPPRAGPPVVAPATFKMTSDLDGLYLWIGPVGAASHVDAQWDSTFGGDVSIVRIREHQLLGTVGGSAGASLWTARGGGRIWVDALAGTQIAGHMAGISAGPILEIAEGHHARMGGSIGVWAFAGVTPFVRIGELQQLGMFAEIGVHIALPAIRR